MTDLTHNPNVNDTRHADALAEMNTLGARTAQGTDALATALLRVIRLTGDGVFSSAKNSDGDDDAKRAYGSYSIGVQTNAKLNKATANGLAAQESKWRKCIQATEKQTTGLGFESVTDDLVRIHGAEQTAGNKVVSLAPAIIKAAREQLKQADDLTEDQLREIVLKPEKQDPEVADVVAATRAKLKSLINGDKGPQCADAEIVEACEKLTTWLQKGEQEVAQAAFLEQAQAFGFTVMKTAA